MRRLVIITFVLCFFTNAFAQVAPPSPLQPIPSPNQLKWQDMEMYAFIHYSMNTYTDQEWGFGDEDPKLFNPQNLDCRQWARTCKQAGMKGIILTAKAQEKPQVAEVIAVGPGGMVDGHDVVMTVKPGDKVITSKYSGTEVKVDDVEYTIVRQSDILAVIE